MKVKGKFGTPTYNTGWPIVKDIPPSCLCTLQEALSQDKPLLSDGELSLPLGKMEEIISGKAAFTLDFVDGPCRDYVDVSQVISSSEVYSSWDATSSQCSACCDGIIQSKYVFGGLLRQLDSEFCIRCCDVTESRRCFEVDGAARCASCYFCHNIEGCEECLFCHNVKGLRYAVLNKQLPKEEYLRIKKMVLDYVNAELDKKKRCDRSIFSLSGKK